jgi:hypothetical protein
MLYRLGIMAALAGWARPLCAQVGLASAPATVALLATKPASVGISLPNALVSEPNEFTPVVVATRWDFEPERTAVVTLVARRDRPARADSRQPAGGSKAFTPPGATRVLFAQTISTANAAGRRTDELRVPMATSGTLDLLVIMQ